MKKYYFTFLVLILLANISHAQVKAATANLKSQVSEMGAAFVQGDYKTFAHYTHSFILKAMGGASKMDSILIESVSDMNDQGISITGVTFDEPSVLIKRGKELQATIGQHIKMKLAQGGLVTTSSLIAISTDNGINWKFIDASNKDLATLRKFLPDLSPSLVILPQQPPVRSER